MLLDQRVRRVEIFTVDFSRVSVSGASPQTKLYSKSYRRLRTVGLGGSLPEEAAAAVASRKRDRLLR